MAGMISMAIMLHVGSIFLILLLLLLLVWHFSKEQEFKPFSIKYEQLSLFYKATLGSLFFTGLVVMAVAKFDVLWTVYVMVLVVLHMIVTTVKEHIAYKLTHIKDALSQEIFKAYAKRKYIIDLVLIVILSAVTYAVSL
ncbi:MAG TPA: hypothetical protein EYG70_07390 [Sulfurimonas sp.]|nr:hypothetical protein [Sulfurimonas sp.]